MQYPVYCRRLVDMPTLGIADIERMVRPVTIPSRNKVLMELKEMVFYIDREFGNVLLFELSLFKFIPRAKYIY
jgi:hypothetical protein